MKFSKWIKGLEKKRIIGGWPPVWIPFAMAIILLSEAYVFPIEKYRMPLYYAAGFAFFYAVAHWNVVRILNNKSKK